MAYRTPAEIAESVGAGFEAAAQSYTQLRALQKKKENMRMLADPRTSDLMRSKIIGEHGDINQIMKFDKQRRASGLVEQLRNMEMVQPSPEGGNVPSIQGQRSPDPTQVMSEPQSQPGIRSQFSGNMPPIQQVNPQERRDQRKNIIQQLAGLDPQLANVLERQEGRDQKRELEERKFEQTQARNAIEDARYNEKQILPIQEAAIELAKTSDDQVFALQNMLTSIKNGDVGVFSKGNLSESLKRGGWIALSEAAQTEGASLFKTSSKAIFSGAKEIFPGRVTDRDAGIFQEMMATVGRDEAANEVAVETLLLPRLIDKEKATYTLNLIRENPNLSAIQLNTAVFDHMEEYKKEKYDEWQQKLSQWGLKNKPREKFSFIPQPKGQQQQQKRSLSEILK